MNIPKPIIHATLRHAQRKGGIKSSPTWGNVCAELTLGGYMIVELCEQRPGEAPVYWYTLSEKGRQFLLKLDGVSPAAARPQPAPAPALTTSAPIQKPSTSGQRPARQAFTTSAPIRGRVVIAYDRANGTCKVRDSKHHIMSFTEIDRGLAEEFAARVNAEPQRLDELIAEFAARKSPRKNARRTTK